MPRGEEREGASEYIQKIVPPAWYKDKRLWFVAGFIVLVALAYAFA